MDGDLDGFERNTGGHIKLLLIVQSLLNENEKTRGIAEWMVHLV